MKILITGANGLVGQNIQKIQNTFPFIELIASSLGERRIENELEYYSFDLSNSKETNEFLSIIKPDVIVNCAAISSVDVCDKNQQNCLDINLYGVRNLLTYCKEMNIHLIQLSTDFVFDGENGPYEESDDTKPLNFYGKTKLLAEDLLLTSAFEKITIIRTVLVYGEFNYPGRSNILHWIKQSLEAKKKISVVNDQFRTPTFAKDLANACVSCAILKKYGIYHISGEEMCSIFQFAKLIAKTFQLDDSLIVPVSTRELKEDIQRPFRTGFKIDKAKKELNYFPNSMEENLLSLKTEMG